MFITNCPAFFSAPHGKTTLIKSKLLLSLILKTHIRNIWFTHKTQTHLPHVCSSSRVIDILKRFVSYLKLIDGLSTDLRPGRCKFLSCFIFHCLILACHNVSMLLGAPLFSCSPVSLRLVRMHPNKWTVVVWIVKVLRHILPSSQSQCKTHSSLIIELHLS